MPCGAGYPTKPCPFGWEGRVLRTTCGACKHFTPPPHILAWCMLYDRDGTVCKRPKSDCATCPEKAPDRKPGRRVVDSPVDWSDPESVRKYWREQAESKRDQRAAAMASFMERHPDYFKNYRKQNPDKFKEAQKRYRAKKREERNREQGEGEVQRDPRGPRSERDQDLPAPRPDDNGRPRGAQPPAVPVSGEPDPEGLG